MDDLVKWLGEQLDEDERTARATTWEGSGNRLAWELAASATIDPGGDDFYVGDRTIANHVIAWDPARVLREIDAKRRIVNAHGRPHECIALSGEGERSAEDDGGHWELWELEHTLDHGPCTTLRLLALPYADRPGYREDWRP